MVNKKVEHDPNGKSAHEPGSKLDGGKTPVYRGAIDYFPRAISLVAAVSAFGASKYAWKGWQTVPDGYNRYSDAMVRHVFDESKGAVLDPDSGLLHAAHVAWNALARLELLVQAREEGQRDAMLLKTHYTGVAQNANLQEVEVQA